MSRPARVALVAGLFLLGFVVVLVAASPLLLERAVAARAEAAGVKLAYASSSVGFFRVTLTKARFGLVGAPQIEGTAEELVIDASFSSLGKVTGRDVVVRANGALGQVGRGLAAWSKAYPATSKLESSFQNASLTVTPDATSPPVLVLAQASVTAKDAVWQVKPNTCQLYGANLGATEIVVRATPEQTKIFVGGTEAAAPIVAILDVRGPLPQVDAELRPTSLALLEGGTQSFEASGKVSVKMLDDGSLGGTFAGRLAGYVPPAPKEVRGLFGAATDVSGSFSTTPSKSRVELLDVKVLAGALSLRGKGHAEIPATYALVDLALSGSIPCNLLGAQVAKNTLPGALGGLVGGLVAGAVSGDVPVATTIQADTRALAQAKVSTTAEVRCGLGR